VVTALTTKGDNGVNHGANSIEPLRVFRNRFYACLGRRADALFELCVAILTTGRVPSPPHLSLVSVHRCGWGSLYAALRKGEVDEEGVRNLLACCPLGRNRANHTPFYAVDLSVWPHCDAEASPGRGVPLPPISSFGGTTYRRRMGLPARSAYELRARLVGGAGRYSPGRARR
jgi:hypothetical protein